MYAERGESKIVLQRKEKNKGGQGWAIQYRQGERKNEIETCT